MSSPALGPVDFPWGRCYFCQRGEVIIAQPLPAGRPLQPSRGAWGRDAGQPWMALQSGGVHLPTRASRRLGGHGPIHLCSPVAASPGDKGVLLSETCRTVLDCAHWGTPRSLAATVPHSLSRKPGEIPDPGTKEKPTYHLGRKPPNQRDMLRVDGQGLGGGLAEGALIWCGGRCTQRLPGPWALSPSQAAVPRPFLPAPV